MNEPNDRGNQQQKLKGREHKQQQPAFRYNSTEIIIHSIFTIINIVWLTTIMLTLTQTQHDTHPHQTTNTHPHQTANTHPHQTTNTHPHHITTIDQQNITNTDSYNITTIDQQNTSIINQQNISIKNQQNITTNHHQYNITYATLQQNITTTNHHQQNKMTTSESWLSPYLARQRDSHDVQWQTYRSNLPVLVALIILWKYSSKLISNIHNQNMWILGTAILLYSLRSDIIIYLTIVALWFIFCTHCHAYQHFLTLSWTLCIGLLYINELTSHFAPLSQFLGGLMPLQWLSSGNRQISCGQFLNMTVLKMLSFGIDLHRGSQSKQLQKHRLKYNQKESQLCLKGRNMVDVDDFSFISYMNYMLFAPTLLTGPPTPYKNFMSFRTIPSHKKPQIIRFCLILLSFQLFQHLTPIVQLSPSQTFVQAQIIALFHLVFIWYKFLIIWKMARLWSQLCGVEVVDNLSRCVCNNYNFQGFWRMWHRGFNQWLVRYLYIPLGGNKNLYSVVATVAFVAFWHDHSINIVIWGLLLVLFISPQILIKRAAKKYYAHLYPQHWFKYGSALLSALYIYVLVISNIIGFGYGGQQIYVLVAKMREQWLSVVWSLVVLTSAVILMFYQRSQQKDHKNY